MSDKFLSTGISTLDNELEGGLLPGSLVYMTADSMAMAEIFLYQFLQQRPTYYVNTERKPEFIVNNLKQFGFKTTDIIFINVHGKSYEKEEKLLDYGGELKEYKIIHYLIKQLQAIEARDVNLIIDTITFFLYLNVKRDLIRANFEVIDTPGAFFDDKGKRLFYNTTLSADHVNFINGVIGEGTRGTSFFIGPGTLVDTPQKNSAESPTLSDILMSSFKQFMEQYVDNSYFVGTDSLGTFGAAHRLVNDLEAGVHCITFPLNPDTIAD